MISILCVLPNNYFLQLSPGQSSAPHPICTHVNDPPLLWLLSILSRGNILISNDRSAPESWSIRGPDGMWLADGDCCGTCGLKWLHSLLSPDLCCNTARLLRPLSPPRTSITEERGVSGCHFNHSHCPRAPLANQGAQRKVLLSQDINPGYVRVNTQVAVQSGL